MPLSRVLAFLLLWLCPALAGAQGLDVAPVQVFLSPRDKSALVSLRNSSSEPKRYQLKVMSWRQDERGEMKLEPTRDIALFPGLLSLKAGEERNARVGVLTAFAAVEKTYRLFIEELPPPPVPGKAQVRVLTRVGIPIFLEATQPRAETQLEPLALGDGKLRFALKNTGNTHVRPSSIRATGLGGTDKVLFEKEWTSWYVLAGDKRVYESDMPAPACAGIRKLNVEIGVGDAPLKTTLATPEGACGE
jgi:fimbrial chaperone protein